MSYHNTTMNEPLVSVVMSIYNCEKFVDETIQSVINQTYKHWELIIVNNCSTDNTLDIINNLESNYRNIKVYSTDSNSGGPAVPRNIGVQKAKGKFVAFIDSDDIWHPKKLEIQLPYLDKYKLVCSINNVINNGGILLLTKSLVSNSKLSFNKMIMRNSIRHSSVVVHKDLFLKIMFDEDKLLNGLEDIHAYLQYLAINGDGILIGKPLVNIRIIPDSLGSKIIGQERLAKSSYILLKCMISTKRYDSILSALLFKIIIHIKYLIKGWFRL